VGLPGTVLSGGKSATRERAEDDFYATPIGATLQLLSCEPLSIGESILEPACGQGHILEGIRRHYNQLSAVKHELGLLPQMHGSDLVWREDIFNLFAQGYGMFSNVDFLGETYHSNEYDNVITNPPFSLAQSFIEKALDVAKKKVMLFCKIQLLEGASRKEMFQKTPLKNVYVFSKRINPLRNGEETDEKGKPWASTMCFAWFVWDKRYKGEPVIKWL